MYIKYYPMYVFSNNLNWAKRLSGRNMLKNYVKYQLVFKDNKRVNDYS